MQTYWYMWSSEVNKSDGYMASHPRIIIISLINLKLAVGMYSGGVMMLHRGSCITFAINNSSLNDQKFAEIVLFHPGLWNSNGNMFSFSMPGQSSNLAKYAEVMKKSWNM